MLGRTLFLCLITLLVLIIIADLIDARRLRSYRPSRRRTIRRNSSPSNSRRSRTGTATFSQTSRRHRTTSTRRGTTPSRRTSSVTRRRTSPSTSRRRTSPQQSRTNTRRRGTTNTRTNVQRRGSSIRRTSTTRRRTTQNRRVPNRRTAKTSRRRGMSNQRRTQSRRRNTSTTSRRRGTAIHSSAGRRATVTQVATTEATPVTTTIQPPTAETQVPATKAVSGIPPQSTSPLSSLVQLIKSASVEPSQGPRSNVSNIQTLKGPSVTGVEPIKRGITSNMQQDPMTAAGRLTQTENVTEPVNSTPVASGNSSTFAVPLMKIPIPFAQTASKSESRVVITSNPDMATGPSTGIAALPQGAPQRTGIASPIAYAPNSQILPQPANELFKLQKLRIPFMMTALAPKTRTPANVFPILSPQTPSVKSVIPQPLGMEFDQGKLDAELSKVMTESDLLAGGPTMTSRALPILPKGSNALSVGPNGSPSFPTAAYQGPSYRPTTIRQSFSGPQQSYRGAVSPSSFNNAHAVYRAPYSLQGASASAAQTKPIQTPYQPYYAPNVQSQYTQYRPGSNTQTNRAPTSIYRSPNLPYVGQQQRVPIKYTAPTSNYGTQIGVNPRYGAPTPTGIRYVPYAGSSVQYPQRNTQYSPSGASYRPGQPRYSGQSYRVPQTPTKPVYQPQYVAPQKPYSPTKPQYAQTTTNAPKKMEPAKVPKSDQQALPSSFDPLEPQVMNFVREVEKVMAQTDAQLGTNLNDSMPVTSADPTNDLLAKVETPASSSTIQYDPLIGITINSNTGDATIQGTIPQTTTNNTAIHFTCPLENGLFPHPQSCSRYIECSGNTPQDRPCTGGLVFNTQANGEGSCDNEINVKGCCGLDKSTCP